MKQRLIEVIPYFALIGLGLAFALPNLESGTFGRNEGISIWTADAPLASFFYPVETETGGTWAPDHQPIYFKSLGLWIEVIGFDKYNLRLFSVLFYLGSIILNFYLLRRFFSWHLSLIVTILLASSPFFVDKAQYIRHYAMSAFVSYLCFVTFLRFYESRQQAHCVQFFAAQFILFYTNMFSYPIIVGLNALAIRWKWDRENQILYRSSLFLLILATTAKIVWAFSYRIMSSGIGAEGEGDGFWEFFPYNFHITNSVVQVSDYIHLDYRTALSLLLFVAFVGITPRLWKENGFSKVFPAMFVLAILCWILTVPILGISEMASRYYVIYYPALFYFLARLIQMAPLGSALAAALVLMNISDLKHVYDRSYYEDYDQIVELLANDINQVITDRPWVMESYINPILKNTTGHTTTIRECTVVHCPEFPLDTPTAVVVFEESDIIRKFPQNRIKMDVEAKDAGRVIILW